MEADFQIACKDRIGHHASITTGGVIPNIIEVNERIMLGRIFARGSDATIYRHRFHITFPCEPFGLQVICQVGGIDMA